jgi:ATP phosphoribosyltransferase regulatory subunit
VKKLFGTHDLSGDDLVVAESLESAMSLVLSSAGYDRIETPILERADLFVRKSGGEINTSLYSFTDPGGVKVSLRPEFTSSVIRNLIEDPEPGPGPFRRGYSGPVFRYGDGAFRQMTQVGAELIGVSEPAADAEIIDLALKCLQAAQISEFTFCIGHLGLVHDVLRSFGLSEPVRMFVASNMDRIADQTRSLEDLLSQAQASGLVTSIVTGTSRPDSNGYGDADETTRMLLRESIGVPIGRRSPEKILDRLLRKTRDATDPASFLKAVGLIRKLAQIKGQPSAVIDSARQALSGDGVDSAITQNLESVIEHLSESGFPLNNATVDLSFARGIAYYTGLVFEVQAISGGAKIPIGGGGRYDGLVKALGGVRDMAALGFAFNLEQIFDAQKSMPEIFKSGEVKG